MLSSIVKHYGNGDVKPVSLAQTQKEDGFVMGDGVGDGMAGRENGVWMDDAASTGTAFRDENGVETDVIEDAGTWANNLFYAYARRTDDPRFSRFLLTFSNARVCAEWWTLIQSTFGGSPNNTREGAQFFSFNSDDLPGRAWKHRAFDALKTKWMYSQIGDAVGTMGKGQEIIPLQDDRGFVVSPAPPAPLPPAAPRSSSDTTT